MTFHNDYEVVQPFTDSNADVVQAIDKLEKVASDGPEILAERRLVIRDLQSANLTPFSQNTDAFGNTSARMRVESESRQILQRIETHARETRQRTLNTLGVLRYLVGSMAGLPEPKAILYLSDGLEMRRGRDALPGALRSVQRDQRGARVRRPARPAAGD